MIKSQTRVAIGDQRVRTAERDASEQVGLFNGDHPMTKNNSHPEPDEAGKQIPALPRDAGSHANETVDRIDAASEALRHAAEIRLPAPGRMMSRQRRCLIALIEPRKYKRLSCQPRSTV